MHSKSTYFWKIAILSILCLCLQFSQIKTIRSLYVYQKHHHIADIKHLHNHIKEYSSIIKMNKFDTKLNNHIKELYNHIHSHICCINVSIIIPVYTLNKIEIIFKVLKFSFTQNLYKFLSLHLIYKPNWS
jgi:DNA integrity scanning protein DisA with diadenylate cyclase activity